MRVWLIEHGNIYEGPYALVTSSEVTLDKSLKIFCEQNGLNLSNYKQTENRSDFKYFVKQDKYQQEYICATLVEVME